MTAPVQTTAFILVDVADLTPSPSNPRKRLGDLQQLVDSIKAQGVLQPIVVRPRAKGHEIVCGHRRSEAARLAGVPRIPAVVRDLNDDQVLEAQLVENLERADMHPLEEAGAIHAMLQRPGWTQQRVAEKIGRSVVFVAQRVQLLTLSRACREALDDEKISVGVALELARIGSEKTQDEALHEIRPAWERSIPTVSRAREVIEERFRRQLARAFFDTTDPDLVPGVPSCSACPKRTGNQAALFPDIKSPDLCTDPICFRGKQDAAFKVREAAAKKEGLKVLKDKEEVARAVGGWGSAWVSLDHKEYVKGKTKTVRQLLGKGVQPTAIAQTRDGAVVELVPKALLTKALKAEGPAIRKDSTVAREKKDRLAIKVFTRTVDLAVAAARGVSKKVKPAELHEALVDAHVFGFDAMTYMVNDLSEQGTEIDDAAPAFTPDERVAFLAEWAIRSLANDTSQEAKDALLGFLGGLGIDWKALEANAQAELTPKAKPEKKASKRKATK